MTALRSFTLKSARSGSLVAAIVLVIAVETGVMHLWLVPSHAVLAWCLSLVSVASAAWLIGDFRAMGTAVITVDDVALHLHIGWRVSGVISRAQLRSVIRASWREIPESGSSSYANLSKPAEPNVLITCDPSATVRLLGRIDRSASVVGVHVDDPDAFVTCLSATR